MFNINSLKLYLDAVEDSMTDVWGCPGGMTATVLADRPIGLRFRDAFLGTVAAGALSLAFGGPALAGPDACTPSGGGTIETCSGNQSAGIASGTDFTAPPVTTLNVNNLNQAIAPAGGTAGISFSSAGAITITSNTGAFGITTANAKGIYANGSLAVSVTSTGNIATTGASASAIDAISSLASTVTSTGNISTTGNNAGGIYSAAFSVSGATATVTSTGNVATAGLNAFGIKAYSTAGDVVLTSTGNITTTGLQARGIFASNNDGPVTVTSTGNIATAGNYAFGIFSSGGTVTVTSTGNVVTNGNSATGLYANSFGAVTMTSTGNISAGGMFSNGIQADGGGGAITVLSKGNITIAGDDGLGIFVRSSHGAAINVTSTGNISTAGASGDGILIFGTGAVTVTSTGNIATAGDNAHGIYAAQGSNYAGALTVTSTGNITTQGANASGIRVFQDINFTGAITVTSTGNITTTGTGASGIVATGSAAVTVVSTGDIATTGAGSYAINARSLGALTVTSTGNLTTAGNATAIFAFASGGTGALAVTSTGNITTAGDTGAGILAVGHGAVTVTSAGNIATTGNVTYGIVGESLGFGGPINVTVTSGTVSGGTGLGAGVALLGGTDNTLVNRGTVMALSGLAIVASTGNDSVSNFGTVIGNVDLGAGTNAFNNMAGAVFNAGATVSLGAGNTLTNAGMLSPGGAGVIQTTALTGNLVQTTTGRLAIDFNMAGASADRVNVSGTANLAGVVQLQVSNPQLGAFQQTIVSAAGGTTINGLSLLASPALQAQLVFPNATDVVVKSAGVNFAVAGLGVNQTVLGNALNGAAQTAGLGGPIFNVLLNGVTSLPGYNAALNQLSGEAASGTQQATFSAMNTFMGTMLDPFNRGTTSTPGSGVSGFASESDASAYASDGRKRSAAERDAYAMFTKAPPQNFEARWNVWAAGYGGSQTTDGSVAAGTNGSTSRIAGTAVGADYLFSPNTIAGFALAGGGTSYTVGNGLGSGRSDLFQAGVYARHTMGAAYIAGALAYGWQDITTNRTVTLAGFDQLQARFNANAFSGRVEGGYRFVSPWIGGIGITPYAAAQFTTFDLPAYAEQATVGTNNFALAYGAKSVTDPRSEFGFRTDKSFAISDGVLTLRGRLAWAHDYDPSRSIGATFQTLPGASFVVNGAAQASDSVLTTASVEMKWRNNWSVAATFEGEFSKVTSSYAGKGVVRYAW